MLGREKSIAQTGGESTEPTGLKSGEQNDNDDNVSNDGSDICKNLVGLKKGPLDGDDSKSTSSLGSDKSKDLTQENISSGENENKILNKAFGDESPVFKVDSKTGKAGKNPEKLLKKIIKDQVKRKK